MCSSCSRGAENGPGDNQHRDSVRHGEQYQPRGKHEIGDRQNTPTAVLVDGSADRDATVTAIAERYGHFVDVFHAAV